jgi:surfeit locus 1 family protein
LTSISPTHAPSLRSRLFWAALAAVCVALTLRLGFWQLSRAEQKIQLQQAIDQQAQLPPLDLAQLHVDPSAWAQTHRRVVLQGEWLNDKTVFLDNRAHRGRVGFWVMTPLRLKAGQVVWVQRGWVERDALDPRKMPLLPPPTNNQTVEARIAPPLSQIFELGRSELSPAEKLPQIRANLDLAQMQALVQDNVLALVVQTGTDSDSLRRDWFEVGVTADKNRAYAFQWFALGALMAFLYLWFQWIKALLYGRQTN